MKKLFALGLLSVVLFNQNSSAQTGKGQMMLGGSLSVSNNKTTYATDAFPENAEEKATTISINPQLGFGIGKNWIVGLKPGYTVYTEKSKGYTGTIDEYKNDVLTLAVFARKFHYFNDRFGMFGQLDAGYGMGKAVSKPNPTTEIKSETNSIDVAVRPGAFFKAGRFVIEAAIGNIGYSSVESKPAGGGSTTTSNRINFSLTNSLALGFHVIL